MKLPNPRRFVVATGGALLLTGGIDTAVAATAGATSLSAPTATVLGRPPSRATSPTSQESANTYNVHEGDQSPSDAPDAADTCEPGDTPAP